MKPVPPRLSAAARASAIASLAAAALLAGCAVGPDFHTPDAPPTQRYTRGAAPS
ncbi:hypothetical protein B1M_07422, partial [Burkholderia sp. TJI49]